MTHIVDFSERVGANLMIIIFSLVLIPPIIIIIMNNTNTNESGGSQSVFSPELILLIITFAVNIIQSISDAFLHIRRFESKCCGSSIVMSRNNSGRNPEVKEKEEEIE